MRATEFYTLPDKEKHFMKAMAEKNFTFVVNMRQNLSEEDARVWGLTRDRMDELLIAVAQHQAGNETIPNLADGGKVPPAMREDLKRALIGRLRARRLDLESLTARISDTIKMLESTV